mmetsp:Transcript_30663/g.52368  ORF Transcript_30663/g.52368 Transcript_30663/m.52368 type:complete len:257 (-) Transcript_30663:51-821(-)
MFYRGALAALNNILDKDGDALLQSILSLEGHINNTAPMNEAEIGDAKDIIAYNAPLLPTNFTLLSSILKLIDIYEGNPAYGPMFIGDRSKNGIQRTWDASNPDGKQLERVMIQAMQSALDELYHGTLVDFHDVDRDTPSVIEGCGSFLDGRKWLTSNYFPGNIAVDPPAGYENTIHLVDVNGTNPAYWGRRVAFADEISIRPLGLYLVPGRIATVQLPQDVVGLGFKIQVGANVSFSISHQYASLAFVNILSHDSK